MKRRNTIIKIVQLLLIFLILVLFAYLVLNPPFGRHSDSDMLQDNRAAVWNGNQYLPQAASKPVDGIIVPCFDQLTFYENKLTQKVNFYNPEENDCYFKFSLYSDGSFLWESGYVQPGNGFYEIDLKDYLAAGCHDGFLRVECFTYSGEALNSAKVHFNLTVI